MRFLSGSLVLCAALQASAAVEGGCENPVLLDAKASALKRDFNAARAGVRLVFIIDPVCPGCLRAASDMNRTVLVPNANQGRLATFVVHVPVLGAKREDTQRACKVLTHAGVKHYWDPAGEFGRTLAKGMELKNKKGDAVYAWDVWLMYASGAEWNGELPPRPDKFMHQLWALSDGSPYEFLDAGAFATSVQGALKPGTGP